jgi:DNA-binding transcriptional MerR regulator
MDGLMSIGALARRAGLTAKALRHYDRIGIFGPACVDGSGYRWYTREQLDTARLIARLRAVDVPLDEVRRCLAEPALLPEILTAHERRLEARLIRVRGDLHELAHLIIDHGADPMTDEPEVLDHRRLGAAMFNGTWDLMEKEDRTPDDDDRMVHMTHASAHHWRQVGKPENFVRSEWQCSRVYAVLRRPEPCRHHAQRALDICTEHGIADWDLAFCHEALARAHAIAGDTEAARAEVERALAVAIAEDQERALLLADLETIPAITRFW